MAKGYGKKPKKKSITTYHLLVTQIVQLEEGIWWQPILILMILTLI